MIKSQRSKLTKILKAFEQNNEKEFSFYLENYAISSNASLESIGIDLTIIEHVLQTPKSSTFVKICLKYGENFYKKNNKGLYIMDYAIQSLCAENLDTFLEYFNKSSDLRLFHQISRNRQLKNGNNYLHDVIEKLTSANFMECGKIISKLLYCGCNPNHLNANLKSPFELLLDKSDESFNVKELIDIFTTIESISIEINESYLHKLVEMAINDRVTIRKTECDEIEYLCEQIFQGNENEFIKLLEKADSHQVSCRFQDLMKASIEMNFTKGVQCICSCINNEPIYQNDFYDNEDLFTNLMSLEVDDKTPLFYAVSLCRKEIIREFLKFEYLGFHSGTKHQNVLHEICSLKNIENYDEFLDCFNIIIKDKRCNNSIINAFDFKYKTPLMYACENGHKDIAFELLCRGAYIGHESIVNSISEQTLKEFLNECIVPTADLNDPKCKVQINYKFLIPQRYSNARNLESEALNMIASHSKFENLLKHPVFTTFLELKWKRVNFMIYTSVFLYFLFFMYLCLFILNFFNNDIYNRAGVSSQDNNDSNGIMNTDNPSGDSFQKHDEIDDYASISELDRSTLAPLHTNVLKILFGRRKRDVTTIDDRMQKKQEYIEKSINQYRISLFGTLILTICEILQFVFSWRTYFFKLSNWVDCTLLCLSYIVLLDIFENEPETFKKLRAVLFLVIAVQSFILIAMVSKLSLQLAIFKKVGKTFLKFIMLYFMLIFAFAMAFYTLFDNQGQENHYILGFGSANNDDDNSFDGILLSTITVIRMMLSDFDAIKGESLKDNFNAFIFLSFILLITIILFNLLNALAINDTQKIMKSAEIVDIRKRIKLIGICERILVILKIEHFNIYSNLIQNGRIVLKINKDRYVRMRCDSIDNSGIVLNFRNHIKDDFEMATLRRDDENVRKYSIVEIPQLFSFQKYITSFMQNKFLNPKLTLGHESIEKINKHLTMLIENEKVEN